jgi:two-component system chemotaxis response regulator CheY
MAAITCIVVDDIAFVRKVIKDILISAKFQVLAEAENGDEAILMYKRFNPDFVTMDIVMPKKGGIEATRTILEIDKEAKIIAISAIAHEHVLMDAINAGMRDFIIKPFARDDLLRAVERVMAGSEGKLSKGAQEAPGNV